MANTKCFVFMKQHKAENYKVMNNFIDKKTRNLSHSDKEQFRNTFWQLVDKTKQDDSESDLKSITRLKSLYDSFSKVNKKNEVSVNVGRAHSRIRNINRWLRKLSVNDSFKYLDVGCSEAAITEDLTKHFNLQKGQAYGTDIELVTHIDTDSIIFTTNTSTKLPFDCDHFDLITAFMALHHFTHPHEMFSEIHRVLKPGGYLIIREHDVTNKAFATFLDMVHLMYTTIFRDEETPEDFVDNYHSFYRRKEVWSRKFISPAGFAFKGLIRTYDIFNSYYACYERT